MRRLVLDRSYLFSGQSAVRQPRTTESFGSGGKLLLLVDLVDGGQNEDEGEPVKRRLGGGNTAGVY
jgi:hypothetical protein